MKFNTIEKTTLTLGLTKKDVNTEKKIYTVAKLIKIYCQVNDYDIRETILSLPKGLYNETPPHLRHPNPDLGIKLMEMQTIIPTVIFPAKSGSMTHPL